MRPAPGQVLHFSEDSTIKTFKPHVAATAQQPEAYVWAVDADRAPDYFHPHIAVASSAHGESAVSRKD